VLGVKRTYLHAAMDEMTQRFGSIEGYFADGLGIESDRQQHLRHALIES
jgi:protein-tyrosine phosphatase